MKTRLLRRRAVAAAAIAGLLLAGGCASDSGVSTSSGESGSGDETSAASEPSGGASDGASEEEGAESAGSSSGDELDRETLVPTITDAMLAAGSVRLDAAVKASGQSITIEGSQRIAKSVKDNAVDVSLSGEGVEGRLILLDTVLYLDLGQPTGGKFVRVDLTKAGPGSEMFDQLLRSTDTTASVESLQGAIKTLDVVGTEQVDGAKTTHYRLTVNTKKALTGQQLPPEQTKQLPNTLAYELWVDEDDLLRKMTADVAGAAVTFTLSDWGKPVDITAPPKAQISKQDPFTAQS
ncbi:N/A [soil metagenome]